MAGQVIQCAGLLTVAYGFRSHLLCLGSQSAGDDGGNRHDCKRNQVSGVIHRQGIIWMGKKDVESAG